MTAWELRTSTMVQGLSGLPLEAQNVGVLRTRLGERIVINHLIQDRLQTLAGRDGRERTDVLRRAYGRTQGMKNGRDIPSRSAARCVVTT